MNRPSLVELVSVGVRVYMQVLTTLLGVLSMICASEEKLPQLFQTPPPVTDALLPLTVAPG